MAATQNVKPRSIPWTHRPIHTSGSPRADPYPNFDATPNIRMYQTSSYRDSTRPPIPPIQKGLKFWPWSSTTFFFLSRPYHITLHGWFAWLGAGSICTEAEAQYEARQVTAAVQKAGSFQQKSQHRTVMGSGSLVSLLFFMIWWRGVKWRIKTEKNEYTRSTMGWWMAWWAKLW